ncbi:hypothetical protein [Xylella fastidiosa]|uniref:hypothetical protein n=1 Tax=Xylella fastidiosa TaxID=2371 RepID=UPI000FEC44F8|nr:hypothetical protein [Xylella fastidiosa]MRU28333.1 hypothetical protein [Xylella fastidiosa subsp. multiplex]MRU30723.1 hypothetical protein [Xylella fastidiosa subsp. multiplex]UIT53396.1 DUF3798 domain-containing protein [Xylella fastidiosa subsp. fastidiosa]WLE28544.1 DUF3798 domain-containing protein [Xylella fastidiosa subsp. multiplex]
MKYTVGQIKLMLDELNSEFPEIEENERTADREQTIKLMAKVVNDWLARGYSYAQIAEKLRMKGFIYTSEKMLRHATAQTKRKRKAIIRKPSEKGKMRKKHSIINENSSANADKSMEENTSVKDEAQQPYQRSGSFTPRVDSDDI